MRSRALSPIFGIVLLSLLARPVPARADDAGGTDFCPPCPSGVTEIGLSVVTSQMYDDWRFRPSMGHWYEAPRGLPMTGPLLADSAEGLSELFRDVARQCKRIKFLALESHGAVGHLSFGAGGNGLGVGDMDTMLQGMDCAMAPDARIALAGCNVGRGCRGEDFLVALAAHLLRKGGSVRAATSYTVFILNLVEGVSMNLRYQTLTVAPGLTSFAWEHPPQTVSGCRRRVSEALEDVAAIRERTAGCRQATQGPESFLALVERELRGADESQSAIQGPRAGADQTRLEAAKSFYSAFDDYYLLKQQADGIGPCDESGDTAAPPEMPAL